MRPVPTILVLVLLLTAAPVMAAAPAIVDAVTSPAWVTRNGVRTPIAPGRVIDMGEVVVTGTGARAVLLLEDGSYVKLGENARFFVADAERRTRDGGLFKATLRVVTGAFRFTTAAVARLAMKREIDIRLPTVTAGIRGTDLWGKATEDREFIALIEGRIGVRRDGGEEVILDKPLSVFDAPKGAPTPAVSPIEQTLLARYAQETEIQPNSGSLAVGGKWKVQAVATAEEAQALAAYDRLRDAGYPAQIDPTGRGKSVTYRVRVAGLASNVEAAALAVRLKAEFGFEAVSVAR
jgi:hypothetical protein